MNRSIGEGRPRGPRFAVMVKILGVITGLQMVLMVGGELIGSLVRTT